MNFTNLTTIIGGLLASKLCDMLTTGAPPLIAHEAISKSSLKKNNQYYKMFFSARGPLVPSSAGLSDPTIRANNYSITFYSRTVTSSQLCSPFSENAPLLYYTELQYVLSHLFRVFEEFFCHCITIFLYAMLDGETSHEVGTHRRSSHAEYLYSTKNEHRIKTVHLLVKWISRDFLLLTVTKTAKISNRALKST